MCRENLKCPLDGGLGQIVLLLANPLRDYEAPPWPKIANQPNLETLELVQVSTFRPRPVAKVLELLVIHDSPGVCKSLKQRCGLRPVSKRQTLEELVRGHFPIGGYCPFHGPPGTLSCDLWWIRHVSPSPGSLQGLHIRTRLVKKDTGGSETFGTTVLPPTPFQSRPSQQVLNAVASIPASQGYRPPVT